MQRRIQDHQVRKRVPPGCKLPARFDDFVRARPPFAVEWNNLEAYELKRSALKEAVPFLRLPDGALVAFWYRTKSPAVVLIGAHGELKVLARNFDNFLKGFGAKKSGLADFDETEETFRVPGVKGRPTREALRALQRQFEAWFKEHTSLLEPLAGPDAQAVRRRVYKLARQMLRDGKSKVYNLSSPWWSMDFTIERCSAGLSITYLDYGKWYPVPRKYNLDYEISELLKLVKHKKRSRYELSVSSAGIVSIDRDRELVIVPP